MATRLRRAWSDYRFDTKLDPHGRLLIGAAFQEVPRPDGCQELMLLGFSLEDDEEGRPLSRHRPGTTHELAVYLVSPETPVDFRSNLFEQNRLSPLTPGIVTLQWRSPSAEAAVKSVALSVSDVLKGKLDPTDQNAWEDAFGVGQKVKNAAVVPMWEWVSRRTILGMVAAISLSAGFTEAVSADRGLNPMTQRQTVIAQPGLNSVTDWELKSSIHWVDLDWSQSTKDADPEVFRVNQELLTPWTEG